MESFNQDCQGIVVLADDQAPPIATRLPPRSPRWTDTFAYIANPDAFCRHNLAQYGPIFKTAVFGGTTVFVGSARANQMTFNGDGHYTEIGLPLTTMTMFGEYSLFQRPDLHRQRKSALRPGFTGTLLASYLTHMHGVIARALPTWDTRSPLRLVPAIEAISFDILTPLLLGINLEQGDAAFTGLPIATKTELKRLYQTFFNGFYGLLPWRSPLTAFGRGLQARAKLLDFMRAIIQQRRQESLDPPTDFLGMMLAGQQAEPAGVFSDAFMENQCLLQLWASHYEVTALVSAWIYQVGQYPTILERLRSEQAAILAEDQPRSQMGIDHLRQMTFLENTIKETLRLLPPTSTANRRLTQSVVLDGVLYKKGWTLIAEPRLAHQLPQHFSQPDQFDPDRFLPDRDEGKPYEFIPFGGGVHACLGAQLAMTLTKVFASHLLKQWDWQVATPAPFIQFPLRRIKDTYRLQFHPR